MIRSLMNNNVQTMINLVTVLPTWAEVAAQALIFHPI